MRDVKKWIHDFDNLEPEQQLEIALAIFNHILNGESRIDFREYDKERFEIISSVINELCNEKKALKSGTLEKYIELSQENKLKIANQLYVLIDYVYQQEEQGKKEAICAIEGHKFGKWKYRTWVTYAYTTIDHQPVPNYPCKNQDWSRICARCGFVERVYTEPEEARAERLEQERQEEIKKAKKRLRELEGK